MIPNSYVKEIRAAVTTLLRILKAILRTLVALGDRLASVPEEDRWEQELRWSEHKRQLRQDGWL